MQKLSKFYRRLVSKGLYGFVLKISLIFFATFFIYHIAHSEYFDIHEIKITNEKGEELEYLDKEQIKKDFSAELGKHFLTVNLSLYPGIIQSSYSFVESAFATKEFPSTIKVTIKEKVPFMIVRSDNQCALLNVDAFVLDTVNPESKEKIKDCNKLQNGYSVPTMHIDDLRISFLLNSESTFYVINDISKAITVIEAYDFTIENVELKESVATIKFEGGKKVILSINQDLEIELQRFVVVMKQIEEDSLKWKVLDLRYKRPVVRRK